MKLTFFLFSLLLAPILQAESSESIRSEKIDEDIPLSKFLAPPTIFPPSVMIFKPTPTQQLIYIATHHTNNLESPIAKTIKHLIETERPDICILEGFSTSEGINPPRVIAIADLNCKEGKCGENCYSINLCHQHHIDFVGGDIDEKVYLEAFKPFGIFQKDIVFFLLAQQIPFWHRDNQFRYSDPKSQFEDFMRKEISSWLDIQPVDYTYEDFLAWHVDNVGKSYDPQNHLLWSNALTEFQPYLGENATIYQKFCAYTTYIRDNNIVQLIEKMMKRHSKVLVVYGSAHYINQAQILEQRYGKPSVIWRESID